MPKVFMIRLLKQGSRFLSAAYNYTEVADGPVTGPYRQGQFKVSFFTSGDRVCAVAEVPTPSAPTQCRMIGFSMKKDGTEPVYRTAELNSDGAYCLFGWTEDHIHVNIADIGCDLAAIEEAMIQTLIVAIFDERSGIEKRYSAADGEFESIRFAILRKK